VQHTGRTAGDGGGVPAGLHTVAAGLEAVQAHVGVGHEGVEDADRVGAATHARRHRVGQPADLVQALRTGLELGVHLAHVDHALEVEQRRRGGTGHPVLARAGLGDDPGLAHPLGQQGLAQHVAHLVGAGVVEVLALEVHLGPDGGGEPVGLVEQ
jgi:hypothetical protein